ncbi:cyclophilin-like fold protein [Traorella massiliensis]|nr:cyclophilin-like fold protein [Traorella massiliensis]
MIYYAKNYWNFTKLGRIENVSKEELKKLLGHQDVTVTLSLE